MENAVRERREEKTEGEEIKNGERRGKRGNEREGKKRRRNRWRWRIR